MKHKPDNNSKKIRLWLSRNPAGNKRKLAGFIKSNDLADHGLTHIIHGLDFADMRKKIVASLIP